MPRAAHRVRDHGAVSTSSSALRARPYALVGLGLRLVMARVFFLPGQAKIEGPRVPIDWAAGGIDFSRDPAGRRSRTTTFQLFETQYADLPMAPAVAAYLFSYAEFVLPICLRPGLCHPLRRRWRCWP